MDQLDMSKPHVARWVRRLSERGDAAHLREEPAVPAASLRDVPAWVLLGEPGAGKSALFNDEASATGAVCVPVSEFVHGLVSDIGAGTTLYLDGLDEARASMSNSAMAMRVRQQLQELKCPRFRISCRAADWLGDTDAKQLIAVSPNGELPVYALVELSDQDVQDIVGDSAVADAMIAQARDCGHDAMLRNPQALTMWRAARGGALTNHRAELYAHHAALLADELNPIHRQQNRRAGISLANKLKAAGQLCATLLLGDLDGLTLTREHADARHPDLNDLPLSDMSAALASVQSQLFRPGRLPERIWPAHRTLAEFLGGQWLAREIDQAPLLLPRVLNLLLGRDGRTVAGLRALYAWLATLSVQARERLIRDDPLSVVVYGEPALLPSALKRMLIAQLLANEAELTQAQRGQHDALPWAALWDESWADLADTCLKDTQRHDHAQRQVLFVLNILEAARPVDPAHWSRLLWTVVRDRSRWPYVRVQAARAALRMKAPFNAAKEVLWAVLAGQILDQDDELLGVLLHELYPAQLTLDEAMQCLHAPKKNDLIGWYRHFWSRDIIERVPDGDLPALMAHLLQRRALLKEGWGAFGASRLTHGVLARALITCGERIDDDTLFSWLFLRVNDEDEPWLRRREDVHSVGDWFGPRPQRYKGVLHRIHQQSAGMANVRFGLYQLRALLAECPMPDDLGRWYLDQVDVTSNPDLQQHCFWQAIDCLLNGRGARDLSLDALVQWAEQDVVHQALWDEWHVSEIPEWKVQELDRRTAGAERRRLDRAARTAQVMPLLDQIRQGKASAAWMHRLAMVWKGHFSDLPGDSPKARFAAYSEDGGALFDAVHEGMLACLKRDDLPSVAELADLHAQARIHYLTMPCLTGLEIAGAEDPTFADSWSDEAVMRVSAMVLLQPTEAGTDAWYRRMATIRPQPVAAALMACVASAWLRTDSMPPRLYDLLAAEPFGALAQQALPDMLASFPLRAKAAQLRHLQTLIQAASRHVPQALIERCQARLTQRSLDASQRLYWLTAAALIRPDQFEQRLMTWLGKSQKRAQVVAALLAGWPADTLMGGCWRPPLLCRLIELLTPHAELRWDRGGGGVVTSAMELGDRLRVMVTQVAQAGTEEAVQELKRLAAQPELHGIQALLRDAASQAQILCREKAYRYPTLAEVGQALNNGPPGRASDLLALAEAAVAKLVSDIRRGNDNLYRFFWRDASSTRRKIARVHQDENDCRNLILRQLRNLLEPYQIDAQPEAVYSDEKRADIRLSFGVAFDLPIEIKGEWHEKIWTGLTGQLDRFYTRGRSDGHGLYLVLWTGEQSLPPSPDGLPRPQSPDELRERLEAQMTDEQRRRIKVAVLDVSWP
jgi:hypothetical protein